MSQEGWERVPPPTGEVPAAQAGHEAGLSLPVSVRKCHMDCIARSAEGSTEAAERGGW